MRAEWLEAGAWIMAAAALFGGLTSALLFRENGDRRYASFAGVCLCALVYDLIAILGYRVDPWEETLLMVKARIALLPVTGFCLLLFLEVFLGAGRRPWVFGLLVVAAVCGAVTLVNPADLLLTPGVEARLAPTAFFLLVLAVRNLIFFGVTFELFRRLIRAAPARVPAFSVGAAAFLGGMIWDDGIQTAVWNGPRLSEFTFLILQVTVALVLARRQTERRREAAATERRLRAVLKAMPDRVSIFDSQALRLDLLQGLALEPPGRAGESCSPDVVFPAAVLPEVRATVRKTALTGQAQTVEYAVGEGDDARWFEARTAVLAGGGEGSRQEGVVWVNRDITREKRLYMELEAGAEKFSRLFHVFPDALLIVDSEGRLIHVNEQADALFALSSDASRRPGTILDLYAPGERDRAKGDLDKFWEHGQFQVERFFHKTGGQVFRGEMQVSTILFRGRRLAVTVVRDRTEALSELERQEREARGAGLRRLAGAVAHAFLDRLTTIAERLDRLVGLFPRGSSTGECVGVMRKATNRGLELSRQLRDFSVIGQLPGVDKRL